MGLFNKNNNSSKEPSNSGNKGKGKANIKINSKKKEKNKVDQSEFSEGLVIEDSDIGGTVENEESLSFEDIDQQLDFSKNTGNYQGGLSFDVAGDDDNGNSSGHDDNDDSSAFDPPSFSSSDESNEVLNFLDNFSVSGQEEVMLDPKSLSEIQEDIVLDVKEKKSHFKIYIGVILTSVFCVFAFFAAYFVSNYSLVRGAVNNSVYYLLDGKYSVTYRNPIVYSTDISINNEILYSEVDVDAFYQDYKRAIVFEIKNRTVSAYDEEKKEMINIPYEQIKYVINPNIEGEVDGKKIKNEDKDNKRNGRFKAKVKSDNDGKNKDNKK